MSEATILDRSTLRLFGSATRLREVARTRFDDAVVRLDAWFLVFVAVILALGATIAAGLAIWCVVYQRKTFSGRWAFRNFGLKVYFECR